MTTDILKIMLACLVFGGLQVLAREVCGIDFHSKSFTMGVVYSIVNITLCYLLAGIVIPLMQEITQ